MTEDREARPALDDPYAEERERLWRAANDVRNQLIASYKPSVDEANERGDTGKAAELIEAFNKEANVATWPFVKALMELPPPPVIFENN